MIYALKKILGNPWICECIQVSLRMNDKKFDKTIKCFDEPHPPIKIEEYIDNQKPGKFLNKAHRDSYLQQMLWIKSCSGISSIFEVGPGEGFCATNLRKLGYQYETLDKFKVANFEPDYNQSFTNFSADDHPKKYDMACAFQVVEHFPYEKFKENILKLAKISKRYVFISIPYSCYGFSFNVSFTFNQKSYFRKIGFYIPTLKKNRKYREEYMKRYPWAVHYWEIGRKQFPLKKILKDIDELKLKVIRKSHGENPYHYYILCEKI